jgi:hypothetical protein
MIQINFKDCCTDCRFRKIYTYENKLYSNNKPVDTVTIIGCEHEDVCKHMEKKEPATGFEWIDKEPI